MNPKLGGGGARDMHFIKFDMWKNRISPTNIDKIIFVRFYVRAHLLR